MTAITTERIHEIRTVSRGANPVTPITPCTHILELAFINFFSFFLNRLMPGRYQFSEEYVGEVLTEFKNNNEFTYDIGGFNEFFDAILSKM